MAAISAALARRRAGVLALYRTTLKQAALLPADRVEKSMADLRAGFKAKASLEDEEEVKAAIKDGFNRLGYLRTVTPRIDKRARSTQDKHRRTYKVSGQDAHVVQGKSERRRPIYNVKNDNTVVDVDAQQRLTYEMDKTHLSGSFWEKKELPVPSICKPVETVLQEAAEYHKGRERVADEHKLARTPMGKRGLQTERLRYDNAYWDTSNRGDSGLL